MQRPLLAIIDDIGLGLLSLQRHSYSTTSLLEYENDNVRRPACRRFPDFFFFFIFIFTLILDFPHTMQLPRSPLIFSALAAMASLPSAVNAAAAPAAAAIPPSDSATPSKTTSTIPCTASSTSGAFYDLRHDIVLPPPAEGAKKHKAGVLTTDYVARGYDYGANFTLNICAAVVKPVKNVEGVDRDLWANVSAYYELDGSTFSLGYAAEFETLSFLFPPPLTF